MAVDVTGGFLVLFPEKYFRVRFYQIDGFKTTPIQAVYCRDFFADEIKAEAK